jgi:hypothetical protein
MREFKKGSLKSSSGQKVTNPKQAIAISLSEAKRAKEGGMMGKLLSETTGEKKMAKGGMSGFPVKRKGAADKKTVAMLASKILDAKMGAAPMAPPMAPPMMPPGMKHGGSVSKRADGVAVRGRTDPKVVKMAAGGMHKMPDGKMMKDSAMKKMAKGDMPEALAKHAAKPASKAHAGLKAGGFVRSADGIAQRGRTKGRLLNKGGRII